MVNTCNAGAGALAVTVEGPSKVKLECKEVDEGYEFTYSPTAPGDYMITIRYAGVNIAGSPFKAKIEGIYLQHYIIFFLGIIFMDLMKICGQESYQYNALLEIALQRMYEFLDQLNKEVYKNWYSTNIGETTVLVKNKDVQDLNVFLHLSLYL